MTNLAFPFYSNHKHCKMKTIFIAAFSLLFLVAWENREREEGSTSRGPETNQNNNENNRDRDNNPITGDRDDNRSDRNDDNSILGSGKSDERIDRSLAMAGRSLFMSECASCHRVTDNENAKREDNKKFAGPELTEITDRRNDRWLVKFMTNSDGDDNKNKDADEICNVQKKGKELNRDQALKVLEYLHMRNQETDQQ